MDGRSAIPAKDMHGLLLHLNPKSPLRAKNVPALKDDYGSIPKMGTAEQFPFYRKLQLL